jgi:carbonic anhydrase/acetyltransferase-like protein (isoleucine patch superfamily)
MLNSGTKSRPQSRDHIDTDQGVWEGTLQVQSGAMVAAGAVVAPGTVIPSGQLWGGNPARFLRELKPEEKSFLPKSAKHYVDVADSYK